jgi:hypothetical protein
MLLCTRDAKENMAAAAADPADDLKHALSGTSGGIPPMAEKHHLVLNYGEFSTMMEKKTWRLEAYFHVRRTKTTKKISETGREGH